MQGDRDHADVERFLTRWLDRRSVLHALRTGVRRDLQREAQKTGDADLPVPGERASKGLEAAPDPVELHP